MIILEQDLIKQAREDGTSRRGDHVTNYIKINDWNNSINFFAISKLQ